jgi:hypothetical protein
MVLLAVQARGFTEETPKTTNIISQDTRCPGGDQNRPPPPCKSEV